jgi:hypothetical protein
MILQLHLVPNAPYFFKKIFDIQISLSNYYDHKSAMFTEREQEKIVNKVIDKC